MDSLLAAAIEHTKPSPPIEQSPVKRRRVKVLPARRNRNASQRRVPVTRSQSVEIENAIEVPLRGQSMEEEQNHVFSDKIRSYVSCLMREWNQHASRNSHQWMLSLIAHGMVTSLVIDGRIDQEQYNAHLRCAYRSVMLLFERGELDVLSNPLNCIVRDSSSSSSQ